MGAQNNAETKKWRRQGDTLTVYLSGEIDHCQAERLREEIEERLRDASVRCLRLDFSRVSFMDSSGIGMIIGRYKTMAARGGRVTACALKPPVDRLFRMGGLHKIIAIEEERCGA